eukprot:m.95666 g.95666  ORF g.95666 m.95666 type:complete len:75 (-) comp15025_c0_seq5:24-248(-)
MADFDSIDIAFSRIGAETRLTVIPMGDRGLVDAAVGALSEHQILGLAAFWSQPLTVHRPASSNILDTFFNVLLR